VKLDDEQRKAVLADEDYCLLIAGAGAGKTTTMAAKVKFLVDCQRVRPEDIIVISYTNKAIDELKDRINNKLNIPVKICTFHSFGYEILRQGNQTPPSVNFSFYITQGENECYLEHFGISENYQSQLYSKNQLDTYVRHITDKRKLHKQNGTSLIQTWYSYNDKRPLLEHLEEALKSEGFILKPRDNEEVYRKLANKFYQYQT